MRLINQIENVLKDAELVMTRQQIKRCLSKDVTQKDLDDVLASLDKSGKILDGRKGILGVYNPSPKLDKAIKEGIEV